MELKIHVPYENISVCTRHKTILKSSIKIFLFLFSIFIFYKKIVFYNKIFNLSSCDAICIQNVILYVKYR